MAARSAFSPKMLNPYEVSSRPRSVSPLKSVSPEMGTTYVVDAFMVVVLGGVQSLVGTLASSTVLGEASGLLAYYSNDTIAKALVLVAIVIIIRFRPQGLFAPRVRA